MRLLTKNIKWLIIFAILIVFIISIFKTYVSAPKDFPVPYNLTIENGQTLFSISHELVNDRVIKSPRLFEMFMISFGSEKNTSEGEYYFDHAMSSLQIALRISTRSFGVDKRKVTFPEGFTIKDMSARLSQIFPLMDINKFSEDSKGSEGYLFPDTYSFFPNTSSDVVIATLKKNFDKKITPLESDILSSGHNLKDIIIMASIIEKEANGNNDREMISGILWKRLSLGLPLQVDAPFLYILNKESKDLTKKDLATKSPYNTYLNKGLPPTAINNPGLASIKAAINPVESKYLYYLHGTDRNIHYASTYAEHQANIRKYLK